ncbi:tetratricopeptide repeat protein [Kozakia baliensis]|uniref:tetratricopeptide repeat protein n=1 Tax=Kozakia baliensis TaxID=153496 RepID=UPI000AF9BF54|nr:tetratricopeptide repeat protein [Kozakia baliensis]
MADEFFTQAQAEMRAEMRAQEMRAMVRRYAAAAIGAAVVVCAGIGVWQWRVYEHRQTQALASERYFTAMHKLQAPNADPKARDRNTQEAAATFSDLATHAPGDIRAFAALRLAQVRMQAHDRDGAVKAWTQVREDQEAAPSLRSLARLLMLNAKADSADPATLRHGYETLASSAGPWRALAQEGLVNLDLRKGATPAQQQEAHRLLTGLVQSPDAPDGVRQRANALLQTFGGAG